ncbi:MAG TPA: hypothetical protein DCO79_04305 [Spirochaeta sp.]|nr:hypothetical protein [Spirochaeta sp.]
MQKFYCDNCGTKVSKNAAKCPKCGRFFKSVRCPSCGLTGSPDIFVNGCPSCGYAGENSNEGFNFYDIDEKFKPDRRPKRDGTGRFFSEHFYKRAIPVLFIVIILLIIILLKTGW